MSDALIRCPSCDHELRVPPELLGRAVECPQCGSRFTSPTTGQTPIVRPAVEPVGRETFADDPAGLAFRARAAVRPPAILLIVTCIVGLLWNGLWVMISQQVNADPATFRDQLRAELDRQRKDLPVAEKDRLTDDFLEILKRAPLFCGVLLVGHLVILLGAIQMLRLKGYGLAVLGSVFALNPINLPCCLLQFPFGLWALIVLLNHEVRAAFR